MLNIEFPNWKSLFFFVFLYCKSVFKILVFVCERILISCTEGKCKLITASRENSEIQSLKYSSLLNKLLNYVCSARKEFNLCCKKYD